MCTGCSDIRVRGLPSHPLTRCFPGFSVRFAVQAISRREYIDGTRHSALDDFAVK